MRSPIALSALSLLVSSTLAAPLLGSAGTTGALFGSVKSVTDTKVTADVVSHVSGLVDVNLVAKGVIKGDAELKVFIDLLVAVVSGAKYHAYTDAKIIASLAAKLKFDAFAKWSTDVCIGSYHKDAVCTELSGYIAAAYYAYITGSAGADLFAAIGSARVDRWHTVLDGICSIPTAHHQSCDLVYASFDAWVAAAAKVDIVAVTATRARLDGFNLFASLDAYAKTTITAASATTAHVSRSNDNDEERGLSGAGNVFGAVHGTVASVTKLKLGKDGLALGSITGVAADGTLLVDGLLLTDVLAHYGATLDSDTFLSLNKGTLYLFSKTTAAVDSFAGIKLDKRILGEIVAGAKAKVDAAVAGSLDKHGLRLGAITGLAADGVLLVDGKLLPEVLAVAGIKLDSVTKGFLQITKDGLYLFGSSYTDASAIGGGSVTLRRGLPVAPAAPVTKVVSATSTQFDSTGKLVIDKDGFYLGTITGASADGILLIDGVLLPEVLASYGLDLKNGNFVKIGKGGLYFYSGTTASAGASGKVVAREMEERLVGGLEATQVLDGAAAAIVGPIKGKGHGHGHGVAELKLDVVTDLVTKLGVKL